MSYPYITDCYFSCYFSLASEYPNCPPFHPPFSSTQAITKQTTTPTLNHRTRKQPNLCPFCVSAISPLRGVEGLTDEPTPETSLETSPETSSTSISTQITMFPRPRTQFSSQGHPEHIPSTTPRHSPEDGGVTPQGLSDTLQTTNLGGNGDTDRPLLFPVTTNPTVRSSLAADTHSPSQKVSPGSGLPNVPKMGGRFNNAGFQGTGAMASPISPFTPPRHIPPLYHSIELPRLDDNEPLFQPQEIMLSPAWSNPALGPLPPTETAKLSHPAEEPTVLDFLLQMNTLGLYTDTPYLHDIVRRAFFDPSFSLHPLDPSIAEQLWDVAAGYDMRGLSILFLASGMIINVESCMRNRGIARVGRCPACVQDRASRK